MNLDLANDIFNNLKGNKFVKGFINELSNSFKTNTKNTSKEFNDDNKWNNLTSDNLTLYDKKIITQFRNEILLKRTNILQNYAENTKEKGEMLYVYDIAINKSNSYNLCYCNSNESHKVVTKSIEELPVGSNLGSVLRKQNENFILDVEATKIIEAKIDSMIKEEIEKQNKYLNSKRIDGHIYEVGEKYSEKIWLYDLNNVSNNGIEGIEEINFPKDLYEIAKPGDLFIYKNGVYSLKKR